MTKIIVTEKIVKVPSLKKLTDEEFDDLRAVLTSLRVDCQYIKTRKEAVEVISKKTRFKRRSSRFLSY